jgi:ATP-dependent helicase/DNAse subunit B
MPLTLVTGPANSAKAQRLLEGYRANVGRGALLVVPTAADVDHYEREVAAGGAVFGGRVVRWEGLFREIARRAGLEARVLGGLAREALVHEAIARAALRALEPSAEGEGFAGAAGRLVADLQRAMVEPERLARSLLAWAGADRRRRAHARETAAIYGEYRRALERAQVLDADGFAWQALDRLRAAPARWGGTPVFLYGFDDLTPVQLDAVETLARVVGAPVTASLSYEAGRVAFDARAATVEALKPLAARHEVLPARRRHYAVSARGALHHLERSLFEPGAERVDPGGAVRLLEAGGERGEVELVAAEVLELMRSGTPPQEIAVVLRSPGRRLALVEEVFGAYGVPLAAEHSVPLRRTALGRGWLALVRCALAAEAGADDLVAYLRTPGRIGRAAAVDALEAAARQRGVRDVAGARALWEGDARPPLRELDRLAAAARTGATALLERLGAELVALFSGPYRRGVRDGGAAPLPSAEDAAVLAAGRRALRELGTPGAGAATDAHRLLRVLGGVEVRFSEGHPGTGVEVTDPLSIRARRFRAVFLCGLQEGEWPAHPAPEPFLSDDRRREIALASGLRLPRAPDPAGAERYLFYACASRPEERLYLSYRVSDEDGAAMAPSSLVDDVRALFTGALHERRRTRPLSEVTWAPDRAPTPLEQARSRAARGPRRMPAPLGPLRAPAVLDELRARPALSAGALEQWAACPVRWLVERHLRPEAIEPEPEPVVRGRLAHEALELVLRRLAEARGSSRVTPASLPDAERLLTEVLDERAAEHRLSADPTRARAGRRRLERDLMRVLRHEAAAGGTLEPRHLELRFGDRAAAEEAGLASLELGEGAERVSGRIDRVDVDGAGHAVVRDYKGADAPEVARWREERRLQVGLYALASRRLLALDPVAGLYQPLTGPDLRARGLVLDDREALEGLGGGSVRTDRRAAEAFEAELAWAERTAVAAGRALRAGALRPEPTRCAGGSCAYPGMCGSGAA